MTGTVQVGKRRMVMEMKWVSLTQARGAHVTVSQAQGAHVTVSQGAHMTVSQARGAHGTVSQAQGAHVTVSWHVCYPETYWTMMEAEMEMGKSF